MLSFLVVEVFIVAVTNPLFEVFDAGCAEGALVLVFDETRDFSRRIDSWLHDVVETIGVCIFSCVEEPNRLGDSFIRLDLKLVDDCAVTES